MELRWYSQAMIMLSNANRRNISIPKLQASECTELECKCTYLCRPITGENLSESHVMGTMTKSPVPYVCMCVCVCSDLLSSYSSHKTYSNAAMVLGIGQWPNVNCKYCSSKFQHWPKRAQEPSNWGSRDATKGRIGSVRIQKAETREQTKLR